MLQFGPYIIEQDKKMLSEKITAIIDNVEIEEARKPVFIQQDELYIKVFPNNLENDYKNEQECMLELQSIEGIPIMVAYEYSRLLYCYDYVMGDPIQTYCKEQDISITSFRDDLVTTLSLMANKGWMLPKLHVDDLIWCEDCDALYIINFAHCERINRDEIDGYLEEVEKQVQLLFSNEL